MTARDLALRELDAKRLPNWPANVLPSRCRRARDDVADARDLALAEQLTVGVIKNLLLLQHLTEHYSKRNLKSIDPLVQKIVAIALYQLRFLTRVPPSAAVDEAVKQARRYGQARAAGFVNAVLRNATREPQPPLPGPEHPSDHARIVLSHPPELWQQLDKLLGTADALRFCEHDQREPPTIIRLAARISPQKLLTPDVSIVPHEQEGMFVVQGAKRSLLARWAQHGLAQVQDITAASVVPRMDIRPGLVVLDRCAGLGTKTLQMWEKVGQTGRVVAMDANIQRVQGLRELVAARNLANVQVHHASWIQETPAESFDRVLIDAPCSNSGVLARRPEARYHQFHRNLASLAKLQEQILNDTAPALKPGGLLVYSTCSVWPQENQHRAAAFLSRNSQFELIEESTTLPSFDPAPTRYRDGGYYAVLRRRRSTQPSTNADPSDGWVPSSPSAYSESSSPGPSFAPSVPNASSDCRISTPLPPALFLPNLNVDTS